jgi:hypothetical protein
MYLYKKKRKRPGGQFFESDVWSYKIYRNGKVVRGSTGKKNYLDAKRFVKILEGRVAEDKPLPETSK